MTTTFVKMQVYPFLKWAGGKRKLLPTLSQYFPSHYNRYYEPFVGAGAVLFYLLPRKGTINDTNWELINCYRVIRDYPEHLINLCMEHQANHCKEYFYRIRNLDRGDSFGSMTSIERASRIIYLNKTCFNGLYRVNRKGEFNAPYGYSNPSIIDPIHIRAVSSFLNKASIDIGCQDFEDAVASATEGDLVYFDPPYDPLTETSNFTSYDKKGFGKEEQKRLKRVCDRLRDRGCFIVQSNSDTEFIRSLYSDYKIDSVKASRAINSKGDKRGKVGEVIIHA